MLKRSVPYLTFAVLAATVLFGASLAFAGGGAECKAEHTTADYTKMAEKMAKYGYLGLEKEKNAQGGYTVTAVAAGSPAAAAGFRAGDVLVAMNGVRLADENKEALYKVKSTLGVGKQVTYTVSRAGRDQQLTATLGTVPREVLAQWVGEHVLDNHSSFAVAAAGGN
jgi:C-terminal processing protease CtpA/Prc